MLFIDVIKRHGKSKRRKQSKRSEKPSEEVKSENVVDNENDDGLVNEMVVDYERRNSLPDVDDDFLPPLTLMTQQRSVTYGDLVEGHNQKMTCFSEVGQRLLQSFQN